MSTNADIFVILIINYPFPQIFHTVSTDNQWVFHRYLTSLLAIVNLLGMFEYDKVTTKKTEFL
jgi:hypothetical protein